LFLEHRGWLEAFLGNSEVLAPAAFHICRESTADSGIGSRRDRRFVRAEVKVNYLVPSQVFNTHDVIERGVANAPARDRMLFGIVRRAGFGLAQDLDELVTSNGSRATAPIVLRRSIARSPE
jgi:hypothetical protein